MGTDPPSLPLPGSLFFRSRLSQAGAKLCRSRLLLQAWVRSHPERPDGEAEKQRHKGCWAVDEGGRKEGYFLKVASRRMAVLERILERVFQLRASSFVGRS